MPKIKFSLNSSSIASALERLEKYADKVETIGEEVVEATVDKGADTARNMAMAWEAYDTGELYRGIIGEVDGEHGAILSTAPHSAYVEFGTGIEGERNEHPEYVAAGWKYDIKQHGDKGWFYKDDDGILHWTKGMPARPFMYDSAQILRQSVPYIVEGLLSKE